MKHILILITVLILTLSEPTFSQDWTLQGQAKIDSIFLAAWPWFGMMPYMHLGIVEYIFKQTNVYFEITMIKMTNWQCENVDNEKIIKTKPHHCQRKIFYSTINDCFHPMKPEVSRKSHFLNWVMNFMKFPKKRHSVQQPMYPPLDKIPNNK